MIGYFSGADYNVFNSVVNPQTKQGYVKPIGPLGLLEKSNYLTLTFAQETYSYVTVPNSLREGVFHFVSLDKSLSAEKIVPKAGAPPMTSLLTYLFSSDPDPIQVSFPQTPISARLNIAVFEPSQAVYCSQIEVAVPIGTDAPSLFASPPSGSINTNKWTLSSQAVKKGSEWAWMTNRSTRPSPISADLRSTI